ncbi:RHS repeat-associated core domain-containing protein [Rhodanobacter glycinis]|uniref:RHS repeat-associated core domain-containing protein n=1 Tax=Rhodanobacter glycinis TaxID=582702 RepID=A0A502C6S1_9GAMM|nr:RHS repeat-associated core domain-containing protein [Rhodanobacter glycinis]TPG08492.1 RHS repeat-associated core domain-containing protein [Rhodanobacter glycinis]
MTKLTRILVMMVLWTLVPVAHAGTHHYYYTDPQGTVLAKADANGTIIATYDYAPYGTAVASMNPAPNGPGYTGHVNDADTGLVYMQARYYDPGTGRFLSVDPVTPSPGNTFNFNRYDYTNNNPINHIDPDGRCIWDGCIVEIVVAGALLGGGIDVAAQKYFHPNQPINKTEVAISAAGGAVTAGSSAVLTTAAVAGSVTVGQAVLRQAAVSGAVGAASSAANDVASGKPVSGQSAVNAAGANIAGSLVSSGFSGVAGDFAGASENSAMRNMSGAAVNTPAGIGGTVANTTRAVGSTAAAPSMMQSAASQSAKVGDVGATVVEKKLNENQN